MRFGLGPIFLVHFCSGFVELFSGLGRNAHVYRRKGRQVGCKCRSLHMEKNCVTFGPESVNSIGPLSVVSIPEPLMRTLYVEGVNSVKWTVPEVSVTRLATALP